MCARPTESEGRHRLVLGDDEYIRIRCAHCAKKLRVRSVHAGEKVKCPSCNYMTPVPSRFDGLPSLDEVNQGVPYERQLWGIPVNRLVKLALGAVIAGIALYLIMTQPWKSR